MAEINETTWINYRTELNRLHRLFSKVEDTRVTPHLIHDLRHYRSITRGWANICNTLIKDSDYRMVDYSSGSVSFPYNDDTKYKTLDAMVASFESVVSDANNYLETLARDNYRGDSREEN